jgi:hypothetical protein
MRTLQKDAVSGSMAEELTATTASSQKLATRDGQGEATGRSGPSQQWPVVTSWFPLWRRLKRRFKMADGSEMEVEEGGLADWVVALLLIALIGTTLDHYFGLFGKALSFLKVIVAYGWKLYAGVRV